MIAVFKILLNYIPWGILGSVVLSAVGFIIGIRAGKNNADRAALRALYTEIYTHLRDMDESLHKGVPKTWDHFPLRGSRYVPVIRELSDSGKIHILPKAFEGRLVSLEADVLNLGQKIKRISSEITTPRIELVVSQKVDSPTNPINGKSYTLLKATSIPLMEKQEIDMLHRRLVEEEIGFSVQLAGSTASRQLYIYPQKMRDGSVADLLLELVREAREAPETKDALADIAAKKRALHTMLGLISKRIAEPHPLIETIVSSVRDPFRL